MDLLEGDLAGLCADRARFRQVLTHDVDLPWYYSNMPRLVAGDLLKRRSIPLAMANLRRWLHTRRNRATDPYDTFNQIMDMSEAVGMKCFLLHHGIEQSHLRLYISIG